MKMTGWSPLGLKPSEDYPNQIKRLRGRLGLTQQALADRLGVSFVTVNRWENGQTKPSQLPWSQLRQLEMAIGGEVREEVAPYGTTSSGSGHERTPVALDFTADPEAVKLLAEGERLSFGHLANPTFAIEISSIDPLPHQRIAVYDHMLKQPRLRFLLADDAGAGKTIMSGLYIREMLSRRLLRRILIVPPAGLVGNWHRELLTLFNLPFRIVEGSDARDSNPFTGSDSDQVIVSIDTLAGHRVFSRLQEPAVTPYDLVIFDEAHKLAADRGPDWRVRKTERYRLAEALAGVSTEEPEWQLRWRAHHLLLLTATPHMGKEYPYFALWKLLEPEVLSTPEAFAHYPQEQRQAHFIRRTKEEMVYLDGRPMYPKRITDTLGYDLTQGDVSEQTLYEETSDYLRFVYNKAKLLNREAARLAMSVFQRRLASSTYALLRSFERRTEKLTALIDQIQDGRLSIEQLLAAQRKIREADDVLEAKTAEDETPDHGAEESELSEDKLLQGVIAASLADLLAEREQVRALLSLAKAVTDSGQESKFSKLDEVLLDPKFSAEKFIVFTEHRDTLEFLVRRLNGLGYTDQVAQIHGGMHYTEREQEVDRFRQPLSQGGARFLVCTDAAGEGINLQFCWIMINYDIPWNPARLEQRMGRIHRYGQKHDPVVILNLVAPSTREGKVLKVLLDKLDKIRAQLHSDKVFDCVGRVLEGVSIKEYMERALNGSTSEIEMDLDNRLNAGRVQALIDREKKLFGAGQDVAKELPRLRTDSEQEVFFRLLPGYVRQYVEKAAAFLGLSITGDLSGVFSMQPARPGAMDPLLPVLDLYPEETRGAFSLQRPATPNAAVWLRPGEPVFEGLRMAIRDRLTDDGNRGAIFVDPGAEKPYLFHLALVSVIRKQDTDFEPLAREELLTCQLVGAKQDTEGLISPCPIEHLLLLRGGHSIPAPAQKLAAAAVDGREQARAYLVQNVAQEMVAEKKEGRARILRDRQQLVRQGFDFQEADLASARAKHWEKARDGNREAARALEEVKRLQRQLADNRRLALECLEREPELISPGNVTFVAHALVVPSSEPADLKQHEADVELVAMAIARAFEEAAGATVLDVHTPELARAAGLPENPGFDLLSIRQGNERRAIEVKGRAGTGDVEVSANEWAKACNMRNAYWLYAAYDCATPNPRLMRVQDPFGSLLAKAKGSVLVAPREIIQAAEVTR